MDREEGRAIAEAKLAAQGSQIAGYRHASNFDYDDDAKTFLEREVGLAEAAGSRRARSASGAWSYRWFRPQAEGGIRREVTPSGDWVGFQHEIPEDAPRPAVTDQTGPGPWRKPSCGAASAAIPPAWISSRPSSVTRPKRVDRKFTWKSRDFDVKGASYRFEIDLLGDDLGGYREYLKVPEQWTPGLPAIPLPKTR